MTTPLLFVLGVCLGLVLSFLVMFIYLRRRKDWRPGLSAWGKENNQPLLRDIFARANLLIWSATVRRSGDAYLWKVRALPQSLASPLMRLVRDYANGGFWRSEDLPDYEEMVARAEHALAENLPGYHQEFSVLDGDKTMWLAEQVGIQRNDDNSWYLFGVITDVTDRHEAEASVRISANQVRTILERADCMLWHCTICDQGGGNLDWDFDIPVSRLQARIFGNTGNYRTKTIYKGFKVEQLPAMNQLAHDAILGGKSGYEQEFCVQRLSDGHEFWLHEQVGIEKEGPGRWNLFAVTVDVTARHLAEELRLQTEERLQEIVKRVDCILWRSSIERQANGEYIWHINALPSALYEKIFGCFPADDDAILWNKEQVPALPEMHARSCRAFDGGAPGYDQEFFVHGKHGGFWLREQVALRPNGPGRFEANGIITDITARRNTELALAAEKERLAVTLRAMDEAVVSIDAAGKAQFINPAAEKLCRAGATCRPGATCHELFLFVQRDSGQAFSWDLDASLREGRVTDLPASVAVQDSGGHVRQVEGCCIPLRDASTAAPAGAVLVLRDVTDRQHMEDQLLRASKLESVGILAGGIAHDFNNILTAILGNIDLACYDSQASPERIDYLKEAMNACRRARELTLQLLTFSKGGDPVRSAVSLPGVIREVARFALRGSTAKCEIHFSEDLWLADADSGQLGQIIQNLVINSSQAMPAGGLITISASNEQIGPRSSSALSPGDYVKLVVGDTGCGIAAADLQKIFDPYFTTKPGGTGLGLATVYSIVRKHHGSIEVESEQGRGTTFTLRIPALQKERKVPIAESPVKTQRVLLKGRVLVMDDEEPIRRLTARILTRAGLTVELAGEGAEAVASYRAAMEQKQPFDLLIVDLTIPGGMGGLEAMTQIRKLDAGVKAIVSSGYSSDPVMSKFQDFGFAARVTKPFDIQSFLKVVTDVLSASKKG
jgi:signal transduction histidine kinase/ActR/RegA family two-component response regulator